MALPTSGAISLSQVNTELGKAATAAISLNDANVRSLAGVASGAIAMSNLQGKSASSPPTLSLAVTGNGQTTNSYTVVYAYINCTLGGSPTPTTSGSRITNNVTGSYPSITKISNTQFRVAFMGDSVGGTYTNTFRITASNAAGSVSKDVSITFYSEYEYIG